MPSQPFSTAPHPLLAQRRSGVLLHITSLPGPHGSGDLGACAHHFVDWLASAGQTLWQILPLNPAGAGNSPYQSVSAFAGNPLLVDLSDLVQRGWLAEPEHPLFEAQRCDFDRVAPHRMACLQQAWQGFQAHATDTERSDWRAFCHHHAHWLGDYALFMVLDARHGGPWPHWPAALAQRDPSALAAVRAEAAEAIGFWQFVQWRFWVQWQHLRQHAHRQGVHIVGDAPIFVAHHSADVWAHAHAFELDSSGHPTAVAGVPPDYFSATGQRWGNPLYRWPAMAADGHRWWADRLAHLLAQVDVVRLDHFRGFEAHWAIPATEPTAMHGQWQPGPGLALFQSLEAALGHASVPLPIVAEDLGLITEAVHQLRQACGFPGMRIAHFAFGDGATNPYLPHQFEPDTVAYTGTHDNTTTLDWWQHVSPTERSAARHYLGPEVDTEPHWALMRALSASVARTVVFPFQDVLGLDGTHRMNTPGQPTGCWEWRFGWAQVGHPPGEQLRAMVNAHGRTGPFAPTPPPTP